MVEESMCRSVAGRCNTLEGPVEDILLDYIVDVLLVSCRGGL